MHIAITCGYSTSLHTIALIHRLAQEGHQVALCLRVRVLSVNRLRFYLRQLGWRGLRNKLGSRLAPRRGPANLEMAAMREYLKQNGITSRTTTEACQSVGAREICVGTLNDDAALDALKNSNIDLIVYAGGGILRKAFLDTLPHGVLNTHGGPLPQFRGMNAGEWALFHGVRPTVTAHFVELAVDRGPTLFQRDVPNEVWRRGIAYGRGACTCEVVEANLQAVRMIAAGQAHPVSQRPEDGRTFNVMAAPLLDIIERWITEGKTPVTTAEKFRFPTAPAGFVQ